MSYLNIDPNRLHFLLATGLEPREISQFFKTNGTRLIQAGAKLHSVSDRVRARIDFLSRQGGKPIEVFADWVRENVDVEESVLPEALIAQFRTIEATGKKVDREQLSAHARLGLKYLFQEEPPEVWVDFLQTSIGEPETGADDVAKPTARDDVSHPIPTQTDILEIVSTCLGLEVSGGDSSSTANTWVQVCSSILNMLRNPRPDEAKVLAAVSDDEARAAIERSLPAIRELLDSAVDESPVFQVRTPLSIGELSNVEINGAAVLGRCRAVTQTGTAAFVEPLAILVDHELYLVDRSAANRFFPDTGQIIGFPGAAFPKQGELGVWIVEEFESSEPIKLRIRARGVDVYSLLSVPAASGNPDAVREVLKASRFESGTEALFRLADNLVVTAPHEVSDYAQYDFETPLDAWYSISHWHIAGRDIVLGPLPPPESHLDCSDLGSVLKRLLKEERAIENWPKLSRANVRQLVEFIRAEGSDLSEKRLTRLETELEAFVTNREKLEDIVNIVLQDQSVRDQIDREKRAVVERYEESRTDLLQTQENIKQEIRNLKAARTRLQKEKKEAAREISTAVAKAFKKAQEKGIEAAAEIAVFDALMKAQHRGVSPTGTVLETPSPLLNFEIVASSDDDSVEVLKSVGFSTSDARGIVQIFSGSLERGIPVGFVGSGAGYVASRLGQGASKKQCAVVDVGIGLRGGQELVEVLEIISKDADVAVFRGANRSDFDVYGQELEDQILQGLSKQDNEIAPLLVFSFVDSPSSLPIPRILRQTCVIIDLGQLGEGAGDSEAISRLEERLDGASMTGIERAKLNAIRALYEDCLSAGRIGHSWAEVLAQNIDVQTGSKFELN